jgi:hypothetical protein
MRRSLLRLMVVAAMAAIVALLVSAPMVLGQESQGGAPVDASGSFTINPGDYPGGCTFPVLYEASGKAKTITLPGDKGLIITSPGLNVTLTNTLTGTQETYNVTGSVRPRTLEDGSVETRLTRRARCCGLDGLHAPYRGV